jgi:hypothetical protein
LGAVNGKLLRKLLVARISIHRGCVYALSVRR